MPTRPRRLGLIALSLVILVGGCALVSPDASPTATPRPTPTPVPTPRPTPNFTPTPEPTPTPQPINTGLLSRRITVLFAGVDSTPDRVANGFGPLTDAMIVASISADHTQLSMVALPRDVVDIPLGNGTTWRLKANAIRFSYGMDGLERALETTYGVPIDYWVEMNMPDFPRLAHQFLERRALAGNGEQDKLLALLVAEQRRTNRLLGTALLLVGGFVAGIVLTHVLAWAGHW